MALTITSEHRAADPARFPYTVAVPPLSTVAVQVVADALARAEAVDVELHGETSESIDVGPFDGTYYRLNAPDLVVAVDAARALLDQIEAAVLDARQERMDAERHDCSCGVRLEIDEPTCGSAICGRRYAQELNL